MEKYPFLRVYRILINLVAFLTVVTGLVNAYQLANPSNRYNALTFDIVAFFQVFVPFMIIALLFSTAAELIPILVRIEDHLGILREVGEHQHTIIRAINLKPSRSPDSSAGHQILSNTDEKYTPETALHSKQ